MWFNYKAIGADQQIVHGQRQATDQNALAAALSDNDQVLLAAHRTWWPKSPKKLGRPQVTDFCFQLTQLLSAGIPLLSALDDLAHGLDHALGRQLAARLAERVRQGQPLSEALTSEAHQFDGIFIGLVRAGEDSGQLPVLLDRLHQSLSRQDALLAQTRRLLLTPLIAGTVVGLASLFLLLFLVPQIRTFLNDSGQPLPWMTHALFLVADTLAMPQAWLGELLIVSLAVTAGQRHPWSRAHLDYWSMRLPGIGPLRMKAISARLADTFALLYGAGIPVIDVLQRLRDLAGSQQVALALDGIHQAVESGQPLSRAFAHSRLFPPLLVRMLQIGEQTGQLDRSLANLAELQRRELDLALERLQTLIEPAMTVSLGLLLGWIMLALLQPIYSLIGQFQP